MRHLFRGLIAKSLIALGLSPLLILPESYGDWDEICRGGHDNPLYCVNACGDIESLVIVMPLICAVTLLPAVLFIAARAAADRRRAR